MSVFQITGDDWGGDPEYGPTWETDHWAGDNFCWVPIVADSVVMDKAMGGTLLFTIALTDALYGEDKSLLLWLDFGDHGFWMIGGDAMPSAMESAETFTFTTPFSAEGGEGNARFPGATGYALWSDADETVSLTDIGFYFGPRDADGNGRRFTITAASIEMAESDSICIFTGLSPLGVFTMSAETDPTAQVSLPSPR